MIRLVVLLFIAGLLGLAATSCGGGSDEPVAEDPAAEPAALVEDPQAAGITQCLDQWNTPPNYELWLNQGAFSSAEYALIMVGENGNCLMAACAGGAICLVFSSPCMGEGDVLGTTYCPVPGGAIPPDKLAEFNPEPAQINADGTLSA